MHNAGQPPHRSHLFTVRLWLEDLGEGRTEWRGQVRHVLSGEVRYFRDWPTLITLLLAMLHTAEERDRAAAAGSGGQVAEKGSAYEVEHSDGVSASE
jgi:hypothetical protein